MRVGHRLHGHDQDDPVDLGGVAQDVQGVPITVGSSVTDDVNGIVVRPDAGQHGVQASEGHLGEVRQGDSVAVGRVGAEDAGSTRVGDDGEALPRRRRLARERARPRDELRDVTGL